MGRTIFLVATLAATVAHGAVLCTSHTGSGTVRVRVACKATETQLDPVALGLQGPPGQPGERGPALVWKDANGAFVGLESSEAEAPGYGVSALTLFAST